jgi:glycosyltransferase involved in cell wall biosynthesis
MIEVTIGIPTYNRPELLAGLLKELLQQTHSKFFIYVSVNKSEKSKNIKYLQISKKIKNKNIFFFFQKRKLDPLSNFNFLKKKCKTKYFMWLADDDRLSYSAIEILYNTIKKNRDLVTTMPNWHYINSNNLKIIKKQIEYNSNFFFLRLIKFLFIGDDCAIYGMHRTSYIKKINLTESKYFFPNQEVSWNLAYLVVIQLLSCGKISLSKNKNAIWINDDYSQIKLHSKSSKSFFIKSIKLLIRQINFYFLVLITLKNLKKYFELFLIIIFLPFIAISKCYFFFKLFIFFFLYNRRVLP